MYALTTAWRVKMRRQMLGLPGTELARRADITPAAVSLIESGKVENPTHSTRKSLCSALCCDPRWLFDGDVDYAPKGFYTPMYSSPGANK